MGRISNAAMLKDAGFTEGMTVHRKSDDTIATIEKMAAGSITLKVGDALKTCSSDSSLKGDWKPSREKAEAEKIDWLPHSPQNSREHLVAAMRLKDDAKHWIFLNPCSSSNYVAPCWYVQVTHEYDESNMELSPDCSGQKLTLDKDFKFPRLVNHCKIEAGEALILYKDAPQKPDAPVEQLQDVKRRKTGKSPGA
eukprot:s4510_g4.t1